MKGPSIESAVHKTGPSMFRMLALIALCVCVIGVILSDDSLAADTDDTFYDDLDLRYEIISHEQRLVSVHSYIGYSATLVIPETVIDDDTGIEYTVVKIGYEAFEYETCVESVSIPKNVIEIGYNTFRNCINLSKIVLDIDGKVVFGEKAFKNCSSDLEFASAKKGYGLGLYTDSEHTHKLQYGPLLDGSFEGEVYVDQVAPKVTVTFAPNGGSVEPTSKIVTYMESYGELPTPSKDGHTFVGWYLTVGDEELLISADSAVLNMEDHTLVAHWESIYEGMVIPLGSGLLVALVLIISGILVLVRTKK